MNFSGRNILLILTILLAFSCSKPEGPLLGIRVPIGDGKVSSEMPYVVHEVVVDSPAYNAGMRPDDVIIQIDSVPLKGLRHDYVYKNLVLGKKGTTVTFVVERDGETKIIQVIRGGR